METRVAMVVRHGRWRHRAVARVASPSAEVIPIAFTDLSYQKRRPVIVISNDQ